MLPQQIIRLIREDMDRPEAVDLLIEKYEAPCKTNAPMVMIPDQHRDILVILKRLKALEEGQVKVKPEAKVEPEAPVVEPIPEGSKNALAEFCVINRYDSPNDVVWENVPYPDLKKISEQLGYEGKSMPKKKELLEFISRRIRENDENNRVLDQDILPVESGSDSQRSALSGIG